MKKNKIIVAGIGPGSPEDITPAVLQAVQASDVIVGYKYYFRFIKDYVRPDALSTGGYRSTLATTSHGGTAIGTHV